MMTPQGEPFHDSLSDEFAEYNQVIILCGHYEGFDERIREIIKPREISIGDFVLYIRAESKNTFRTLISPYVIKEMTYKLGS
jgi:tRNA (guanine-N1)-methyltransferase